MKKKAVTQDHDLLTEISVAYYQDDMTQEEIAQKYGISRIKVGRLLKKAREEGIVDITVRYHPIFSSRLEQELIETFGVKRALIALDVKDENEQRRQVAALVASYLSATLKPNQTVTVSYGDNIAAIADYTGATPEKRCHFISAVGGINATKRKVNADQIAQSLAKRFSGTSESLYAPAYPETQAIKAVFMQNGIVKEALKSAQQADFAIVEIDGLDDENYLAKAGYLSAQDIADLGREQNAACEITGYGFFSSQGDAIETVLTHQTIGLSVDDLRKIPCVIGIASENTKAVAILSALKSGLIDVIATSVYNAKTILAINK